MNLRLRDPVYVKERIALLGFNQVKFAKHINVTAGYLSRVLNQIVDPSPVIAKKIADGLEVEVRDIFFTSDAHKSETKIKA